MAIVVLFILILNIVSIVLMYYSLKDTPKKEKLVFIAGGTALMYVLTSVVYWISTRDIAITEVSELGKDLITFVFVPINGIIILPLFARSYYAFKNGRVEGRILRNRGIVLGVILIILLALECSYFENIQEQVVNMIYQNQAEEIHEEHGNTISNTTENLVDATTLNQVVENENILNMDSSNKNNVENETNNSNALIEESNEMGENTSNNENVAIE